MAASGTKVSPEADVEAGGASELPAAPQIKPDDIQKSKSAVPTSQRSRKMSKMGTFASPAEELKELERKRKIAVVQGILDSNFCQAILAVNLFVTLFLPDIWVMMAPDESADEAHDVVLIIGFVLFTMEIIANSYCRDGYLHPTSFFFWMDVLGTLSIIIDIYIVKQNMAGTFLGSTENATTLRAARVAKLGARSSRLAKLAKMIKFYFAKEEEAENDSDSARMISLQLNQRMAQRVAALVLFLIVVNPFLQITTIDYSYEAFVTNINFVRNTDSVSYTAENWNTMMSDIDDFFSKRDHDEFFKIAPLVSLPILVEIEDFEESECPTSLKDPATVTYTAKGACRWEFDGSSIRTDNIGSHIKNGVTVQYDRTRLNREDAAFAICIVVLVIILLVAFTFSLNAALDELVVRPMGRIMNKLRSTASRVLTSVKALASDEDDENPEGSVSETDLLELMVDKLARIVNNTMGQGGMKSIVEQNRDMIDEATEQMLNQYSDNHRAHSVTKTSSRMSVAVSISTSDLPVPIEVINSFHMDVLSLSHDQIMPCVVFMFEQFRLLNEFGIEPKIFTTFINTVRSKYSTDPPYHNYYHGADVLHTTYRLLSCTYAESYLSKLEIFATLVAAFSHDVGHPGVNNAFLAKTKAPLALKYNDKSILENMHCSTLYEILGSDETNIMANLSDGQWHDCRKQIVQCILNTDMANHAKNVGALQNFYEVSGLEVTEFVASVASGENQELPEVFADPSNGPHNRLLLQETFLHCADLSNPIKPLDIYQKWVDCVTSEFFSQGDREKSLGMPMSAMCDRETTKIPGMQVGFINFVIAPLMTGLLQFFPEQLVHIGANLIRNQNYYIGQVRDSKLKDGTLSPKDEEMFKKQKAQLREKMDFVPFDVLDNDQDRALYTAITHAT